MENISRLTPESRKRIEELCTEFLQCEPSSRTIDQFCRGFSGEAEAELRESLTKLSSDPVEEDGVNQSMLDAVPSGFLNTSFQDLVDSEETKEPRSARYQIGPAIGTGGIGEVFRVFDSFSQRSLALKTLRARFLNDTAAIRRFLREGLLTGTLQHPGIPPVYDHGRLDDGTPFFSMKLIEGQTLHQILKTREANRVSLGQLIGTFESVAQTLAYVHSRDVIHRDIKPHNIMVGRFGEVQVMDWGLAKQLGQDALTVDESEMTDVDFPNAIPAGEADTDLDSRATPRSKDLTTAGEIVGTPGYMAPEQARGEIEVLDARADVFALGAILYQILSGKTLFERDSAMAAVERLRQGDISDASAWLDAHGEDAELVQLCRRCLSINPKDRPKDAGEVASAVSEYIAGFEDRIRQAEIERSQSEVRVEESRKRQRWIVGMSGALVGLAVVASLTIGYQWRKATRAAAAETIARQDAEEEAAATSEINIFLNEILSSGLPGEAGPDVTLREVNDEAVRELEGRFENKPEVEGTIRRTLGESYRWLGRHSLAEQQLRLALLAYEKADQVDEIEVLETRDRLAGVLRSRGNDDDLVEAEKIRCEVLDRTRTLFGEQDPLTVIAMNNLAMVYLELERLDEAESLFKESLAIVDSSTEEQEIARHLLIANLADVDRIRGNWDVAEKLYLQVIGDDSVPPRNRADVFVQLGEMLDQASRHDDAVTYLTRAVEERSSVFGPQNPYTLSAIRKLTRATLAADRFEDAIPLLRDSIERHAEVFLPASGTICEARSMLAEALVGLGRREEASEYLRETIALISRERGDDHPYAEEARDQLAEISK